MGDRDEDGPRWLHAAATMHGSAPFTLVERGWVVVEGGGRVADEDRAAPGGPDADADWHLVWPPTAPAGHPGVPDPVDPIARRRPELPGPELDRGHETPWTRPTRLTSTGDGWLLEHGETEALAADPPVRYADADALRADLERIECWPTSVAEWRRRRAHRLCAVVVAQAHDDHYPGFTPTEPYASRIDDLRAHLRQERSTDLVPSGRPGPTTPRPRGDLGARLLLLDADAWASAERTREAGGPGWDVRR